MNIFDIAFKMLKPLTESYQQKREIYSQNSEHWFWKNVVGILDRLTLNNIILIKF